MAAFESQKKSARNLVLSVKKQASVAEVMADNLLTRRQRFDGSAVLELAKAMRTDKELAGKGTEFATNANAIGWDSRFSFKAEADDWLVGWALAFVMGSDSPTGAGPYVHTIAFDEASTQAPMTNVYIEDTADVKYKVQDMAVSDVTLTIGARGACAMECMLAGTGRWTDGAMNALPALPSQNFLLNSDCIFSLGPSGNLAALTGRHLSTTLKISQNLVNHTAPGGGLYGFFMRRGGFAFSFSTTIAAKDTDDIRTLMNADTLSGARWVVTTGANVLQIDVPNFKLRANKLGVDGNMIIWQIDADQTSAIKSGSDALSVSVTNTVPAYLAAA